MLSLLIALSAAAQPPTTTAPATADRKEIPLTLILSGGVSLGSYEAGLSWAVTRIAQVLPGHGADPRGGRVRLVAVTGASAGSINAVLSAASWCSDPVLTHTSVDDNPLRNTWVSIGLDRLLPDVATQYQEGDGLLSSRPLVKAFERLRGDLLSGRRPGGAARCAKPWTAPSTGSVPGQTTAPSKGRFSGRSGLGSCGLEASLREPPTLI